MKIFLIHKQYTLELKIQMHLNVTVQPVLILLYVYSEGISPNNDGYNDTFELKGYDVKSLKIYNRYGKLVYSTTNYADNWEGQSNEGDKLAVGTYFYHIIYDENLEKTGWVYINY